MLCLNIISSHLYYIIFSLIFFLSCLFLFLSSFYIPLSGNHKSNSFKLYKSYHFLSNLYTHTLSVGSVGF